MKCDFFEIKSHKMVRENIYETVFIYPDNFPEINPGQFVEIFSSNPQITLPRPISVCDFTGDAFKIMYQVVGKVTEEMSNYLVGQKVKIMAPLGNGFKTDDSQRSKILIGGGIGAAPLLYLAKKLKGEIKIFLGYRSGNLLVDEFSKITDKIYVSTEDGTFGENGNILKLFSQYGLGGDIFYCCGPKPMLKAISAEIGKTGAECQISLEERMACGIGACVGCAVKIKCGDDWQYKKVCKDGPVFDLQEVLWD